MDLFTGHRAGHSAGHHIRSADHTYPVVSDFLSSDLTIPDSLICIGETLPRFVFLILDNYSLKRSFNTSKLDEIQFCVKPKDFISSLQSGSISNIAGIRVCPPIEGCWQFMF